MNIKSLITVISILTLTLGRITGQNTGSGDNPLQSKVQDELVQAYHAYDQALLSGDAKAQDRILADDFIGTSRDGDLFSKMDARRALDSGDESFSSSNTEDLKIKVYGDTAVATGRWIGAGKSKGEQWSGAHRFTDTWVKRAGQWQVLASHLSKIDAERGSVANAGSSSNPKKAQTTLQTEIERATGRWAEAWNKHDAAAVANFYTRDAQILPPEVPAVRGRAAIEKYWQKDINDFGQFTTSIHSVEIEGMGDTAIQQNTYDLSKDGKFSLSGKGITLWKREDGEWKMDRDTWNEDSKASGEPGKLSDNLKQIEEEIGEWEATYTGENGKEMKGRLMMEVDPSGQSVTGYWTDLWGSAGYGRNMWYFDPNTQRIVSFSIGPDGSVGTGFILKRQDNAEEILMPFQGVTGDHKLMSSLDHLKRIDKNTFEYWTTDFVIDGKKQPDSPKMLFKRIKLKP
ncbi:MAG TPA: DUF4440 domain-containing protein [Verrucomicrobiae bacterium]|nr:DUF4440 domain-containing protein [Verrucomicrobiae bacterium]